MKIVNGISEHDALTIDKSAAALGVAAFSLLSRIQAGQITAARMRWGEMAIPTSELERLSQSPMETLAVSSQNQETHFSDRSLGIEKQYGGMNRNGERADYAVAGDSRRFTESEIKSYRAAFGAIATEFESLTGLKKQLDKPASAPSETEVSASQIGRWVVRSKLLNTGRSEILLCQREKEFAVIEHFRNDSPYATANGNAEIIAHGNDARQLTEDFTANAQHTLEFMASNLVAKAQKVVWEQFPDHRPGHVVAAISERCRQAVPNREAISQSRVITHSANRKIQI